MNKIRVLSFAHCIPIVISPITFLSSCQPTKEEIKISSITIIGDNITEINDFLQLGTKILPENASNKNLTWSVNNTNLADITPIGETATVEAKQYGDIVVTAKAQDGSNVNTSFNIKIITDPTGITISGSSYVQKETTMQLLACVEPVGYADDSSIIWSSNDQNIATVDSDGVVKGVGIGTTSIIAKTKNGIESNAFEVNVVETPPVEPESIEITGGDTVAIDGFLPLSASIKPDSTTDKRVHWSSSDMEKATVDQNGKVTGWEYGTVNIIAKALGSTTTDVSTKKEIKVKLQYPDAVSISGSNIVDKGSTTKLSTQVFPEGYVIDSSITWRSSNEEIATVDNDGTVHGIKGGSVDIYADTKNGSRYTHSMQVIAKPESIIINGASNVKVGETTQLTTTFVPEETTDKSVTWTSSDESIATVDSNGIVTGKQYGDVTITATSNADPTVSATHVMKVLTSPTSVEWIYKVDKMKKNCQESFKAKVLPEGYVDNDDIEWYSSNPSVASISWDGLVESVSFGKTTIKAIAKGDTTKFASVDLSVYADTPESIIINGASNVKVGETTQLTTTFVPEETADKSVTWTSSNESIATVDSNGIVTGKQYGDVTITATSNADPTVYATHVMKVLTSPTSVEWIYKVNEMSKNCQESFKAKVLPEGYVDNDDIEWYSSNPSVASISEDGLVTSVSLGKTTIKAIAKGDTTKFASVDVTVINKPQSITITGDSEVKVDENTKLTATVKPDDASDQSVTWTSSDESIATVDSNGIVTGKQYGDVTITATSNADPTVSATHVMKVLTDPLWVDIVADKHKIQTTETLQLSPKLQPEGYLIETPVTYTWKCEDDSIGGVDENGLFTSWGIGTAQVTVSTNTGLESDEFQITVLDGPEQPKIFGQNTLEVGDGSIVLKVKLTPSMEDCKPLKWMSSDESVASINMIGVLFPGKVGTAIITAEVNMNGIISITHQINVIPKQVWGDEQAHINDNGTIYTVTNLADCGFYGKDENDTTTKITCDNKEKEWDRSNFNCQVILNPKLENQRIENYFLSNCSSFNQALFLPYNLIHIGTHFLYHCKSFNQQLIVPDNVDNINDYFMSGCTKFNSEIILPYGVWRLGDWFMADCTSFNQDIVLPNSLNQVGWGFLGNCNSMQSTVDIQNLWPNIFEECACTLSTNNKEGPAYKTGITIIGKYAKEFCDIFVNGQGLVDPQWVGCYWYRNLSTL